MNQVLVVESGAKTRTIRSFLGGEMDVVACGGHIVDLPSDELAIDLENDFSFTVEPLARQNGDAVETIKSKLADADVVYLATDPDREGEAIAADLRDYAVPPACEVHRIEFNAIVYPVVKEAIANPRPINEDRVQAQRARRSLDRLIGFILSSITKYVPQGPQAPSVGRVQSPAIRLLVDREREIEAFEPRQYWTLHAKLETDTTETFDATLDGEWEEFETAKAALTELNEGGEFTIDSSNVNPEDEQNPLPPYTTDALQNDADFLLNFDPERTMKLAQRLYEGVELGDGDDAETTALITYMRTDSTRISPSALNLAKDALSQREDLGEAMYKGRTWELGDNVQDAHEAIRPTHPEDPDLWPENLEGKLDEPLLELYTLIYKRFLASQMVPAVYETTTLKLSTATHSAEAVGHQLRSPGFLTAWRDIRPDHGWEEIELPAPDAGTSLPLTRAWPEPHTTQPPPRYREGALVSELKDRGIGRPSTYGDILTKIKRGPNGFGYARKTGKTLRPTKKGTTLIDYLDDNYPQVVDYEYTAKMEADLDQIETAEFSYTTFLSNEFTWLKPPYDRATTAGWLTSTKPTPAQIEFLRSLAEETNTEIPADVFESKTKVSNWLERLQSEIVPELSLTPIYDAEVGGIAVNRFRLSFNEPLPEEEYEYLSDLGLKYKPGSKGQRPAFQYQRQDRHDVEQTRQELRTRYETDQELVDFEFTIDETPSPH